MTMMALSIVPLHFLFQDNQNEMQYHFFSHLTLLPLSSASCDANSIVNSTTRSWQLKQCATELCWSCNANGTGQCHMKPTVPSVVFVRSVWSKDVQHDFLVMWCNWNQCLCLFKITKMRYSITFGHMVLWFWHWHQVILMAFSMAQLCLLAKDD